MYTCCYFSAWPFLKLEDVEKKCFKIQILRLENNGWDVIMNFTKIYLIAF